MYDAPPGVIKEKNFYEIIPNSIKVVMERPIAKRN